MTDAEFDLLLSASRGRQTTRRPSPGERFGELLRFLRLTGARPGEASKLEWSMVDCAQAVVILAEHKTSRTQRVPKPRVIPLHPDVVTLLVEIRRRNEPGTLVFTTHRGSAWNRSSLALRVQRARQKAGIPDDAKLYGLRHAYGTRAIVNGVDIKTLSELLGHTTTRMSEHYVHLAGQRTHLHDAVGKVNASITPPPVPSTLPEGARGPDA